MTDLSRSGSAAKHLTFGAMIATYRRPSDLMRCLDALERQTRPLEDVIVVHRDTDTATAAALDARASGVLPLRVRVVSEPGVVAARNLGLDNCATDLLATLDDDTAPHADWAARAIKHFQADPALGGLGGRDCLYNGDIVVEPGKAVVGRVEWAGRIVADHHLGVGGPRPVDMLKGANMIFRASAFGAIRFDRRLRGKGAQPYEDLKFTLDVRRQGWKIIYDPAVQVDHFPGTSEQVRHYVQVAAVQDHEGFDALMYNEVLALWGEFSPLRRLVFAGWSLLVGTRIAPGVVQAIRFTPRLGLASWQRFLMTQRAKFSAMRELSGGGTGRGAIS